MVRDPKKGADPAVKRQVANDVAKRHGKDSAIAKEMDRAAKEAEDREQRRTK